MPTQWTSGVHVCWQTELPTQRKTQAPSRFFQLTKPFDLALSRDTIDQECA